MSQKISFIIIKLPGNYYTLKRIRHMTLEIRTFGSKNMLWKSNTLLYCFTDICLTFSSADKFRQQSLHTQRIEEGGRQLGKICKERHELRGQTNTDTKRRCLGRANNPNILSDKLQNKNIAS